jgi:hypothetical protein
LTDGKYIETLSLSSIIACTAYGGLNILEKRRNTKTPKDDYVIQHGQ